MLSTVYPEREVWYICKSLSLFPKSTTIGEINGLTGFLDVSEGKKSARNQETWVQSLGREDLLEKGMTTHSSILAWRIHGQMSLVGYSPWGLKELDMIE